MEKNAIAIATAILMLCASMSQILLTTAASNSSKSISASGIIREKGVELAITRKHLVAYGLRPTVPAKTIEDMARFDLVDTDFEIGPDISQIKALNPDVVILGYHEIMAINTFDPDYPEVNKHEDWFLHDIYGNRLVNARWGWYAMDVGNPGWRSHYANYVKDKLDTYPLFDGVFADDVWESLPCGSLPDQWWNPWTVPNSWIAGSIGDRWHTDMLGMISLVKATIGKRLLILNTDNNGDYVDASDGKMEEGFVHAAWWSPNEFYDDWYNWTARIEKLKIISQEGKYYIAHSGVTVPDNPTQSDLAQVRDIMIYCFASYLLGINGGNATFGFNDIWTSDGSGGYYPELNVSLGYPVNNYYSVTSVFSRDFERGRVLVNPTQSSYSVNLGGTYKTLEGQLFDEVTLNAHSGMILLRQ